MTNTDLLTPDEIYTMETEGEDPDGVPTTASTRFERVNGVCVTNPLSLDAGDDILVVYRERRGTGGLRYTPNAMEFTGRVSAVSDDTVHLVADHSRTPHEIVVGDHYDGRPTLVTGQNRYGVKALVRRTDTDLARNTLVRVAETLAGEGYNAEFKHVSGGPRVVVTHLDTPTVYADVLSLAELSEALTTAVTVYEDDDDLVGETGRVDPAEITDESFATITLTIDD